MGADPSHPELLDWLALEFRDSGWDVQKLFKVMLTSATYRQAGTVTQQKLELDRDNVLFSRGPRFRMDAEMVRDYALSVSGLLSRKMYGPGTKPISTNRYLGCCWLIRWRYSKLCSGQRRESIPPYGIPLLETNGSTAKHGGV